MFVVLLWPIERPRTFALVRTAVGGEVPLRPSGKYSFGVTANPRQRVLAALIDLGIMLGWGVVVFLGLAITAWLGVSVSFGPFGYNLFALGLVVLPITVVYTVMESGRYEATLGKLRVGLRVRVDPSMERVGWMRSLARNLLKLGLPWALGQSAALATISAPDLTAALGLLFAIAVPAAYLASLFIGDGRTVYDWLTGTMVITTSVGRRFADEPDEPEGSDSGDSEVDQPHDHTSDQKLPADEPGPYQALRVAGNTPAPLS